MCPQNREKQLKLLDLGNNSMTDEGVASVARLLQHWRNNLRELNLYMNDIGDVGIDRVSNNA